MWRTIVLFTLFLAIAPAAAGSTISVRLTGAVTGWDGDLGSQFSVGDTLVAVYSYDTDQPAFPSPFSGSLGTFYALTEYYGRLGSYFFNFDNGHIQLLDGDVPQFGDQIFVRASPASGSPVRFAELAVAVASFRDYDDTFLDGTDLITVAPDVSEMEEARFALGFDDPLFGRVLVRADVLSATVVPEPSTGLLVGVGTVMCVVRRRLTSKRN